MTIAALYIELELEQDINMDYRSRMEKMVNLVKHYAS